MNCVPVPVVQFQCDWFDVAIRGEGTFWANCTCADPSIPKTYADVKMVDGTFLPAPDIIINSFEKPELRINATFPKQGVTTTVTSYASEFKDFHKNHTAYGVASSLSGQIDASCGIDGSLQIFDSNDGTTLRTLRGHMGDVDACAFVGNSHPNTLVSCGADGAVRVWSVSDGSQRAVLQGTQGPLRSLAVLGNAVVAAGSRDGGVQVWDLNSGALVTRLTGTYGIVNALAAAGGAAGESAGSGGVLVGGTERGHVLLIDTRSNTTMSTMHIDNDAVNAVAVSGSTVAVGTEEGRVMSASLTAMQESAWAGVLLDTNVRSIAASQLTAGAFWAGTGTGNTLLYHATSRQLSHSLSGPDNDPVTGIAVAGERLVTSARDGVLRKYIMNV